MSQKKLRASNAPKKLLTDQEKMMEKAVVNSRKILIPYFKNKDFTVEFTEWLCENMAVIINSGAYDIMKKTTVAELQLKKQVKSNYPNYKNFVEFLSLIEGMTMNEAINSLQWLAEKSRKVIKDENKERKFNSLNLDILV